MYFDAKLYKQFTSELLWNMGLQSKSNSQESIGLTDFRVIDFDDNDLQRNFGNGDDILQTKEFDLKDEKDLKSQAEVANSTQQLTKALFDGEVK